MASSTTVPTESHSDDLGTTPPRREPEGPRTHRGRGDSPSNLDNAWANVNWATTYSSDEDSQSTASSHCLFPDHLGEEEEEGLLELPEIGTDESPPSSPLTTQSDEIEFLVPPPFVDPVAVPSSFSPSSSIPPPPEPQRTRRRTQSQSHHPAAAEAAASADPASRDLAAAPASGGGLVAPHSRPPASLRQHPQDPSSIRFMVSTTRSLWVTVALVTTVLMFSGLHPTTNDPSPSTEPGGLLGASASALRVMEVESMGRTASDINFVNPSGVPPAVLRGGQRSAFMYAVAARDAPRTFRMRGSHGGAKAASDSVVLHGLYFSTLLGIVLWSARELRREVRARRGSQESICDMI